LHSEESPLVIALAWFLAGAVFSVFILVKLGAFEAKKLPDSFGENLFNYEDYNVDKAEE